MIEMASSFEEADGIIVEFTDYKTTRDKLKFLYETFNVVVVGRSGESIDEETELEIDYEASLKAIVNRKWG
jgi:dihydrodipicolinate reductase